MKKLNLFPEEHEKTILEAWDRLDKSSNILAYDKEHELLLLKAKLKEKSSEISYESSKNLDGHTQFSIFDPKSRDNKASSARKDSEKFSRVLYRSQKPSTFSSLSKVLKNFFLLLASPRIGIAYSLVISAVSIILTSMVYEVPGTKIDEFRGRPTLAGSNEEKDARPVNALDPTVLDGTRLKLPGALPKWLEFTEILVSNSIPFQTTGTKDSVEIVFFLEDTGGVATTNIRAVLQNPRVAGSIIVRFSLKDV